MQTQVSGQVDFFRASYPVLIEIHSKTNFFTMKKLAKLAITHSNKNPIIMHRIDRGRKHTEPT